MRRTIDGTPYWQSKAQSHDRTPAALGEILKRRICRFESSRIRFPLGELGEDRRREPFLHVEEQPGGLRERGDLNETGKRRVERIESDWGRVEETERELFAKWRE